MFKKTIKKNKPLLVDSEIEDQVSIRSSNAKKKIGKRIEGLKVPKYSTEELDSIIKTNENSEDPEKLNVLPFSIDTFPMLYGRDFNADVDNIAKNMIYRSEIQSNESGFNSEEILEENDAPSETETQKTKIFIDSNSKNSKFQGSRPDTTMKSLEKFLQEKLSDIKTCKSMYNTRLADIIKLKQDSEIIIADLYQQKVQIKEATERS
jgi:hypothetical protein